MLQFEIPQKYLKTVLLLLWFLFFGIHSFGQVRTQTIRGIVTDNKHQPLEGVTIYLQKIEKGTTTDENGKFRLEEIPVGRHQLRVSFVGYEMIILSEVLVRSGKEEVLEIFLQETRSQIGEIIVKSSVRNRRTIFPGPEILTIEETLRMPSTYNDPARLTFVYAGVANSNDQANNMIIRGNTPNSMSWRLEGAEIVNPNHLTGAGTFSDRTTQNGGGVNILSAQMLGNSAFYKGAFPVNYGNVLSGIMDMQLRKGNNENKEFTVQLGLIGLDIAAEGPLSKEKGSSFLANYRYSTLGLLSAMGVDLGDEAISFQDLSLHLNFPREGGGNLSVFGIGGTSKNVFEGPLDDSLRLIEKDLYDIRYTSQMAAVGLTITKPSNDSLFWKHSIVYSQSNYLRDQDDILLDPEPSFIPNNSDDLTQSKLSLSSGFQYQVTDQEQLRGGLQLVSVMDKLSLTDHASGLGYFTEVKGALLQPFLEWSINSPTIDITAGVRDSYFAFNETNSFEPRFSLGWKMSSRQKLGFAYGLNSQLQLPQVYGFETEERELLNKNLGPTKMHHVSLAYQNQVEKSTMLKVEAYYQSLFDVPVSANKSNSFSALNVLNELVTDTLINDGTGTNYGVEFTAQQYFYNNAFWIANVSVYDSKYKGSDGVERNTRFNGSFILNLTIGKEMVWNKNGKDRTLGINARLAYLGGYYETPIDEAASELAGETVLNESEAFSIKRKNYVRPDLRIYFTRNKNKYNSTLALDIQNVMNNQNVSFKSYDNFKGEVIQNYQLGLLPLLSYRIEF